jgi:NTE family protein
MAKLGLVFSGGGGKGAYQIGVWKALEEFGLTEKIEAVSGTSVGALNALLFAQGNYALAEQVWLNIRQEDILTIDPDLITKILLEAPLSIPPAIFSKVIDFLCNHGLWSRNGLIRMIRNYLRPEALVDSSLSVYAACTDVTDIPLLLRPFTVLSRYLLDEAIPSGLVRYFSLNHYTTEQLYTIILASSALPFIFKPEEFEGRVYYDGGLMDNLPITPIYQEGCDLIITVQLNATTIVTPQQFPNAELITIVPQENQGGFWEGTIDFSPAGIRHRIQQGYTDTVRMLQPVAGIRQIQQAVHNQLVQAEADERRFQQERVELLEERNKRNKRLDKLLSDAE